MVSSPLCGANVNVIDRHGGVLILGGSIDYTTEPDFSYGQTGPHKLFGDRILELDW